MSLSSIDGKANVKLVLDLAKQHYPNNPILADFGCSNPFNEDGYNNVFH